MVTSGASLIGTNLVNEVKGKGHEVMAADLYNKINGYVSANLKDIKPVETVFEDKYSFEWGIK